VVAADIDAQVKFRIRSSRLREPRIRITAGRRGQELGRAVLCGLGAYALGDECGRDEVLRDGNELAAILLLPGGFVVTTRAEDLEVDVETLADGLVDVAAVGTPDRVTG
jgi:hypothetical protein